MNKHLFGDELDVALEVRPPYSPDIVDRPKDERTEAMKALGGIFCATETASTIYHWMYRAASSSMNRKADWIEATKNHYRHNPPEVIGGTTTMAFLGDSGIGKTKAVARAMDLIAGHDMWYVDDRPIIPFIFVHCQATSVKSLLKEIMHAVDVILNTNYSSKFTGKHTSTDCLLDAVSDILSNNVAVLIIDEIQNVMKSKDAGSAITKLINNGYVSTVFIGTLKAQRLFDENDWLARRMIGPSFGPLQYEPEFRQVAHAFLAYRYVPYGDTESKLIATLYQLSGGRISDMLSLITSAVSEAIENNTQLTADVLCGHKNELRRAGIVVETTSKGGVTQQTSVLSDAVNKAKNSGADILATLRKYARVDVVRQSVQ